jgi:hypothetical protein
MLDRMVVTKSVGRKLELRREGLRTLSLSDLARVVGGDPPENQCTCTTDFSNSCCGPNTSC